MGTTKEGRVAGHHITPGLGWRWQEFGGKLMLVTDGGGADVVLTVAQLGARAPWALVSCSPRGTIERITADHPLAIALAAFPDLVTIGRDICARNDRPRQLPALEEALRRGGLL